MVTVEIDSKQDTVEILAGEYELPGWFMAYNPLENWDKRMKWICFGFTLIGTILLIS